MGIAIRCASIDDLQTMPATSSRPSHRRAPWTSPFMIKGIVGIGGVLLLLYLTLSMAPEGPPSDASHSAAGAGTACQAEVEDRVTSGTFSLSPTVAYRGSESYAVNGVVDESLDAGTRRRNYDCLVTWERSAGYQVDSVSIWQSH